MRRVVARDEIIEAFEPLRQILDDVVDYAREQTTLVRFAELHPEIKREAGLKRLAGQARWMLVADGLVDRVGAVPGYAVLSTDSQHNSGQYVFSFPGGIFTVRREPHDGTDPDEGKYIQEVLVGLKEQADLAPGIDADAALVVYLSVSSSSAILKATHPCLGKEIVKVPLGDLVPVAKPMPTPAENRPRRSRAKSTRRTTDDRTKPGTDASDSVQ